jgi:hypothetical protein
LGEDSILIAVKGALFVIEGSVSVINRGVGGITFNLGIFATTIVALIEVEDGGEGSLFENIGRESILTDLQAVVDFAIGSEFREDVVISALVCHC